MLQFIRDNNVVKAHGCDTIDKSHGCDTIDKSTAFISRIEHALTTNCSNYRLLSDTDHFVSLLEQLAVSFLFSLIYNCGIYATMHETLYKQM